MLAARRLSARARTPRASTTNSSISKSNGISSSINTTTTTRSRSTISKAAAVGSSTSLRSQIPSLFYSTEKILSLRTNNSDTTTHPKTIYDPSRETENCGVGLVASLKSVASRKVVEDADEMLIRMSHRGGVGCCPASGDGAGKCVYICFLIAIAKLIICSFYGI